MNIKDLHNPNNITAVLTSNDGFIEAGEDRYQVLHPVTVASSVATTDVNKNIVFRILII